MQPYVETNCVFTHQDRSVEYGGAVVTSEYCIVYCSEHGVIRDWHGNAIGTYKIISSRPAVFFGHRSWQGERYYYMRASINGHGEYSIRGFGVGMIAKGKRLTRLAS